MTDVRVGDYVIARSKHNNTVIEGEVVVIDVSLGEVSILPTGHRWGNEVSPSDFTFEQVTPPIKFGDGAVARWSNGWMCVRDQGGLWFRPGVGLCYGDDEEIAGHIRDGVFKLVYRGYFPEEDE